jgi:type IV pilus assembly protein PilV
MLTLRPSYWKHERGLSLIEVLVTLVITAFGLLGIAGLQSMIQLGTVEAYQRAQAVVLLSDLSERMRSNGAQAASYVSASALGPGDNSQPADCSTLAAGAARDQCEWSKALQGAAETRGSLKVGAMVDARGCITQVQAPDLPACAPGIYLITVAWQGMHQTKAPAATCGKDLYGADTLRRAVLERVSIGLPSCSL